MIVHAAQLLEEYLLKKYVCQLLCSVKSLFKMVLHVPLTTSAIRLSAQMKVNALRIRPLQKIKKRSQQLRRRELLVVRYELFRQLNTASHILLTIVRFPHIVLIHPDRTAPITPSQSPMPTALEVPQALTSV